MARAIDADGLIEWFRPYLHTDEPIPANVVIEDIRSMPTLTQPNELLTLEELREMDGRPVWVEEVKHWALIDVEKGGQWDGVPFAVWAENGAKFTYNIMNRNLHCYCRPPDGEKEKIFDE